MPAKCSKCGGEIGFSSSTCVCKQLEERMKSKYGCSTCLWSGCECENHKKFYPDTTCNGKPTCKSYTYFD